MILNEKLNDVVDLLDQKAILMSIDTSDSSTLIRMVTSGLYKDPIGSLIREYISNAIDANEESGSKDPVLTGISSDENHKQYFYVKDSGVGISPHRMNNVVALYGASTKRKSNDFIGCFGLGAKTALAYDVSSFFIDTVHDGILYKYMIYKHEKGSQITLLNSESTLEPSGTLIKVYINNGDLNCFQDKIKSQIAYLHNVYYDAEGDYQIFDHEKWAYSTLNEDSRLHILLGKVYYPLDYSKLGMSIINCPIAIKIGLDEGVEPIQSREDIIYTKESIEILKKKIEEVANLLVVEQNKRITECKDIKVYFKQSSFIKTAYEITPSITINISYLEPHSGISVVNHMPEIFRKKMFSLPLFYSPNRLGFLHNYAVAMAPSSCVPHPHILNFLKYDKVIILKNSKQHIKKTKKYRYLTNTYSSILFIYKGYNLGKQKDLTAFNDVSYESMFQSPPHSDLDEYISIYEEYEKEFLNTYTESWEDVVIPATFEAVIKENNKKKKAQKLTIKTDGFLSCKIGRPPTVGPNDKLVFESNVIDLKTIKRCYIYILPDEYEQKKYRFFKLWFPIQRKHYKPIIIKQKDLTLIKDNKYFIHMDKFEKSHHIKNLITVLQFRKRCMEIFNTTTPHALISKNAINIFSKNHFTMLEKFDTLCKNCTIRTDFPSDLEEELLKLAEEYHLYNSDYFEIEKVLDILKFWDVLKHFNYKLYSYSSEIIPGAKDLIVEYCKLKKVRLNNEYYNIKQDE